MQKLAEAAHNAKNLEWGSEEQINAFNEVCEAAYRAGLEEELEEFGLKATNPEIIDWVMDRI